MSLRKKKESDKKDSFVNKRIKKEVKTVKPQVKASSIKNKKMAIANPKSKLALIDAGGKAKKEFKSILILVPEKVHKLFKKKIKANKTTYYQFFFEKIMNYVGK